MVHSYMTLVMIVEILLKLALNTNQSINQSINMTWYFRFHNLGEVNAEQVMIDNNKVELYYTNGELCEDGKTKTSTRIIFYCSQSVKVS
jgi:hypothetical protein